MPAIHNLMKRLGFVKLARYGLVLTPEGRIMSLRPAVLDDGLGGRIVGWPDGDLAAMELQKWEPARPAPMAAVATRVAVAPPPMPMPKPAAFIPQQVSAPMPIVRPIPSLMVPVAASKPPVVAEASQVEEDDWEWEIALARARVATEEAEQAAASIRAPRTRANTVPPPITQQMAVQLPVVQIPSLEDFPKTETMIEYEDRTEVTNRPAERPLASPVGVRKTAVVAVPPPAVVAPLPVAVIPPKPVTITTRAGTSPPTVIPIPKLPSIKERSTQIQPVVSPSSRPSRTRFAKGTGPVGGTHVGPPPAPAHTDKTSPGMPALSAAARTVGLPSVKRFAR